MNRLFTVLSLFLCGSAAAVTLVEGGRPVAKIVIPEKANPVEKEAARELQMFIKKASGAKLKITSSAASGARILIGRAAELGEIKPFSAKIVAGPDTLKLAGGDGDKPLAKGNGAEETPCGTLYAVYEFAERELNARFLWPDERYGIVTDRKQTIRAVDSYDYVPPFENVRIRKVENRYSRRAARIVTTPINYPDGGRGGHAFVNWWKEFGETHPDFFEEVKGKRNPRMGASMCVANPAFHAEVVRRWREARAKEPGKAFAINACENDTKGNCTCLMCTAWNDPKADPGDASERYAHFYKALYELAAKEDPSVRIYGYAYSNYVNPPRLLKLPENVCIGFVPSPLFPYDEKSREHVLGNIRKWQEVGCTLNYRPNVLDGYAMPEDISTDYYTEFQAMRAARMKAIDIDGPNASFATQGPYLYALFRMMVRPDSSLEKLKDEYYSAFGPAKDAVREYWEFWNRYTLDNAEMFHEIPKKYNPLRHSIFFGFHYAFYAHRLFPQAVLDEGLLLLEKALKAAAGSEDDLKRVEFLKAGLEHAKLCAEACAVFAEKKSSNAERQAVVNKVKKFSETSLPKYAADVKSVSTIAGRNEQVAWTFIDFPPEMTLELPLKWRLKLDPEDQGASLGYGTYGFDDSSWQFIGTDRHLEKQGIAFGYKNAWFRTKVEIPEKFRGLRTIAYFRGIDEGCVLYVNGQVAGTLKFDPANDPDTWKKPMSFDITRFIPADGKIVVSMKVVNDVNRGGLWQPSELRFMK